MTFTFTFLFIFIRLVIQSNFFLRFIIFLAVLGLCCCTWVFSSFTKGGYSLLVVHMLFIAGASLVAEHRLQQLQLTGLAASQHVGSSQSRDRTVPSALAGRLWITREVLNILSYAY